MVPFVSVDNMMKIVNSIGIEAFLSELVIYIEEDFRRWELFDKTPRGCLSLCRGCHRVDAHQ